jgi:hypothetical protein
VGDGFATCLPFIPSSSAPSDTDTATDTDADTDTAAAAAAAAAAPLLAFRGGALRHKFCLSPPGNGVDCYRTYEAL